MSTSTPSPDRTADKLAPVDAIVKHGYVDGAVRLHYVEAGTGPLVVLLHGFPEFWFAWRHQIPAIAARGYRVVAPDLRGYGLSDKPQDVASYHLDRLTEDVAALIDGLGEKRAFVVGHDWGGAVAWHFAMHNDHLLRALAICNSPHPAVFRKALRTLRQARRSWYMAFFQLPFIPEAALGAKNFQTLRRGLKATLVHRDAISREELARYVDAWGEPGALTAGLNYYRAAFGVRHAKQRRFRAIEQDVLIVWGERDTALGPDLATPDSTWVPHARVELVPDAGHFVMTDAKDRVNELLIGFLDEHRNK